MPRGVPNNGVRRTRAVLAAEQVGLSSAVADSAVDGDPAVDPPSQPQTQAQPPAEVLTLAEMTSRPADPGVLTPEQREIKALRDQLARERGRKDVEPEVDDSPVDGESILIHFLEDGLTVNGKVMYRGEMLEFVVGSPAYRDTFDRTGRTWLDLRNDEFRQVDRWGRVMFRTGPWPGKTYADGSWESLRDERTKQNISPPSPAEIEAAEKARLRRTPPRLPQQV